MMGFTSKVVRCMNERIARVEFERNACKDNLELANRRYMELLRTFAESMDVDMVVRCESITEYYDGESLVGVSYENDGVTVTVDTDRMVGFTNTSTYYRRRPSGTWFRVDVGCTMTTYGVMMPNRFRRTKDDFLRIVRPVEDTSPMVSEENAEFVRSTPDSALDVC